MYGKDSLSSHGGAGGVTALPDGGARVTFTEAQTAVTPGQSVVFYDGSRVLGGGWIEARRWPSERGCHTCHPVHHGRSRTTVDQRP